MADHTKRLAVLLWTFSSLEESITACVKTAMVLEFFLEVAFSDSSFALSL